MKKLITLITILFMLALPSVVYAAPPQLSQLGGILDNVMKLVLPVGGLLAVAMMVFGGYMWMMSGGDSGKIQQAQGTITWSVLGLAFLVLFRFILQIVFDFIGQ